MTSSHWWPSGLEFFVPPYKPHIGQVMPCMHCTKKGWRNSWRNPYFVFPDYLLGSQLELLDDPIFRRNLPLITSVQCILRAYCGSSWTCSGLISRLGDRCNRPVVQLDCMRTVHKQFYSPRGLKADSRGEHKEKNYKNNWAPRTFTGVSSCVGLSPSVSTQNMRSHWSKIGLTW